MKNIARNWPVIRQVAYTVLAGLLGVAVSARWITDAQSAQWLAVGSSILAAIGLIVASLFVDRTSPAQEQKIEQAVTSGIERATQQVQQQVAIHTEIAGAAAEAFRNRVDPFIRR